MARRPRAGRRTGRTRNSRARARGRTRFSLAALLLLLALALAQVAGLLPEDWPDLLRGGGVAVEDRPAAVPSAPRADSPSAGARDAAEALAALRGLPVAPEIRRGYDRDDWPHWLDLDGDCRDARQEVLIAESQVPPRLSADGCRVIGGLWRDVYTGETFADPDLLDVDHVVALHEAHESGGAAWSRERRAAFANDLDDPRALIAVSRAANRAKGSLSPDQWLPPAEAHRCRYVADWVLVKARWGLSVDESERAALGNLLADCARAERGEVAGP